MIIVGKIVKLESMTKKLVIERSIQMKHLVTVRFSIDFSEYDDYETKLDLIKAIIINHEADPPWLFDVEDHPTIKIEPLI